MSPVKSIKTIIAENDLFNTGLKKVRSSKNIKIPSFQRFN